MSTFFAFLSLMSYAKFGELSRVKNPKSKVYFRLSLLFFTLGLLAKPMLVTLPFVMLLLDFWPLQRMIGSHSGPRWSSNFQLANEKWPFFVLSAASCAVTFLAQRDGGLVMTLQQFSPGVRLGNALLSYTSYLGQ